MNTNGFLSSCAWRDSRCRIGLILGTGTNACYLEDIKNIETINADDFPGQEHMVINTEWGALGNTGSLDFVRTRWDHAVDAGSKNFGKQVQLYNVYVCLSTKTGTKNFSRSTRS